MDTSLIRENVVFLLALHGLLCLQTAGRRTLACEFPESWRGHWHQASLGQVYVTANAISKKGTCTEHYSDYYLMHNAERDCTSCLLMLKRHDNIIQYKESYCVRPRNDQSVCDNILIEAIMYTLVKEPTETIPCPFPENYRVTYDAGYHGYYGSCETTNSYLNSCNGNDKSMTFHFEHCAPDAIWNGQDLRFECLATWKEGSEDFLYGRFSGSVIARKDDSYRCFKYDTRGVVIQVAMSADATCRGLVTPEAGPVVMRLEKDVSDEPTPGCTYPQWLTSSTWRDYSGDVTVTFHGHRHKMSVQSNSLHERLMCQNLLMLDVDEYVISAYAAKNCGATYQCLRFKRLNNRVFTLQRTTVRDASVDAYHCSALHQQSDPEEQVFLSTRALGDPLGCPNPGVYSFRQAAAHCDMHVHIGCAIYTSVLVRPQCQILQDVSLACVTYWSVRNMTYWVVQNTRDSTLHCVGVYEVETNVYRMQVCSESTTPPSLNNVLLTKHGSCQDRIPTIPDTVRPFTSPPSTVTDNIHEKHVPTRSTLTTDNNFPYRIPSTRAVRTQNTVTSSHMHNANSDDDTQTSHQYSPTSGASANYQSHRHFLLVILLCFIVIPCLQKCVSRSCSNKVLCGH